MLTQAEHAILTKLAATLRAGDKPRAGNTGSADAVALYRRGLIEIEADGGLVVTSRGRAMLKRLARSAQRPELRWSSYA